ncbi:adenylosuccinate lyase family protein [Noviherbaspirillum sp. CPCC 100848]|uniref:Adenylosuccinate lyase family protein n=1 Tax=Noviherbaspirillum album TaxID=3080276 RepID=A0ABU6JGM8_9BURK|nr:adenylosuccinate lyase family protein [Noviherbaspirillum sp. CPCC 100848]MEC4722821.1 adenylosuccinate lyase family protein [Noviherbaspirillum sp. CPCC 100848]
MAATVFDSALFRDMFGTPQMRQIFDDRSYVGRCIDAETGLARAQAKAGLIPLDAANVITSLCSVDRIDFEAMRAETEIVGYPILPLVRQLSAMCGEAGRYVHWGATTQDIMDTATMLQCKDAIDVIERQLDAVRSVLSGLAEQHSRTVTAGRTHLQHALPVTFGFRAAVWLSALNRHAERLEQAKERALMVEFGGAAGTLASLGGNGIGLDVRALYAKELGLRNPAITWHVARDGLVELVSLLAAIGGSLGKIAVDVMTMASSEFGEVAEPFVEGRGASSTMPQKRNPISSELMLAAAKMLRERAALMMDAMIQDFERATGPWHLEWSAVPESFLLAASALGQAEFMLKGLSIDTEKMRTNLDITGGLIVAEAVMMGLAPAFGRQQAHDIVYDACRIAISTKRTLYTVLCENMEIVSCLGEDRVRQLTDPANYLGAAETMALDVVAQTRATLSKLHR